MRRYAWLLALFLAACNPTLTNHATVYPPVAGRFNVKWTVDTPGTTLVVISLDGAEIGRSTASDQGFLVELDSRKFANGMHRLKLEARGTTGQTLRVIEHAVLIRN
ncbi:MAG: hypothetical protein JWM80_3853 [Cyanobacteria bacterium RYN_339]|nr:hypothetical protein [Cyanobacteria bacterium RYN_339]